MAQRVLPISTVQREDDLLVQDLEEEIVMANIETGMYFGFGEVARQIWLLLDRPLPVADICSRLGERYDVDPNTCERDVLVFLNELLAQRAIRTTEPG